MLTAAPFPIVFITDYDRPNPLGLIPPCNFGNLQTGFSSQNIGALTHFTAKGIGSTQKHIVAYLIQMAPEFKPGAGWRDVVRSALSLRLDQDRELCKVLALPLLEGLQELKALAIGGDLNSHLIPILSGRHISLLTSGKTIGRKLLGLWRRELEHLSIRGIKDPVHGIIGQVPGKCHSCHNLRAGQERKGLGTAIV